jgi:hypothetical protein
MAKIEPRTTLRDGLALCVSCWGEYPPGKCSQYDCGHSVCLTCDSDYTLPCPVCDVKA